MGGPRQVVTVFQKYQTARSTFAQEIADLAGRPECVEQLMQENVIYILKGLLADVSLSIQQNAAIAVGKLANHSPEIAELLDKEEVLRTLIYVNIERPHRYLKRATLTALRSIVKHNASLARSVVEMGGLELVLGCMEEFDAGVKEAAAFVIGYIARQDLTLALAVIASGCVPLLVMCLQESDSGVRVVSASALADIAKHTDETAQSVLDAGAVSQLIRCTHSSDPKLKRQGLYALASIAKHSLYMAETIMQAEIFPVVLEHAGHTDEYIRKAACSLVKEIVKHSQDLAQMVVEAGGLGVLVNSVIRNKGENRLAPILALGFIAGHTPPLGLSVIYSKGVDALATALDEECQTHVGAAAAWALGHIGRHSAEHAKTITSEGLLQKILDLYMSDGSTEEMKDKAKQALKMILLRTDDLESIQPLLNVAPIGILKYIVAQYSKILPNNPAARRSFVQSGALRKVQELIASDATTEDTLLRDHVMVINACFPPDIINYFSPDYPITLLDRVEQFKPTLNIDPSMWIDRLFSDTKIPPEIKDEIMALQKQFQIDGAPQNASNTNLSSGAPETNAASTVTNAGGGASSKRSSKVSGAPETNAASTAAIGGGSKRSSKMSGAGETNAAGNATIGGGGATKKSSRGSSAAGEGKVNK